MHILNEDFNLHRPNTTSRKDLHPTGDIGCVHYGDIYKNYNNKTVTSSNLINNIVSNHKTKKLFTEDCIIFPDVTEKVIDYGVFTYVEYRGKPYVNGTHTFAITSKTKSNLKYLFYYFQSLTNRKRLQSLLNGSTVFQINYNDLYKFKLENYHDCKETQQHIVDIIGSIDDLIANNEKLVKELNTIRKLEYKRLVENYSVDEYIKCSNFMTFTGGAQPPKSQHISELREGYVRFIQNRDYDSDNHKTYIRISKSNKFCSKKDILICKYGVSTGKTHYGLDGAYNVALAKLEVEDSNWHEYTRSFLEDKYTQELIYNCAIASTRDNINSSILNALYIPKIDIKYIKNFNNFASKVIDNILKIKEEQIQLQSLKEYMLKKYFG